ncbi:hypothetical protein TNCV_3113791 [Trichonephila clavipes]|nr:hypothetical protein TNCV_3113791 [Trichonephila clavipes]
MLPGVRHRLTALFHGCGSQLKTTECVVDGTGGGRVRSTTPRRRQIYHPISKGTGAPLKFSRWQISFLLPQESRSPKTVARRLRGGGLYARRPVVCPIDQTAPYCPFAMVSSINN